MPLYEYYCPTCRTKFEKLQSISAVAQKTECPSGHEGAVRTLSLVAPMGGGEAPVAGCACGGNCSCGRR